MLFAHSAWLKIVITMANVTDPGHGLCGSCDGNIANDYEGNTRNVAIANNRAEPFRVGNDTNQVTLILVIPICQIPTPAPTPAPTPSPTPAPTPSDDSPLLADAAGNQAPSEAPLLADAAGNQAPLDALLADAEGSEGPQCTPMHPAVFPDVATMNAAIAACQGSYPTDVLRNDTILQSAVYESIKQYVP